MLKFLTVVGARPQFIKSAPVSRCLRRSATEVLLHTGQHYDDNMSQVFFRELGIPEPDYNLNIGSGSHGAQTGQMLEKIEDVLRRETPDCVLVYGDTNSTLAGALAAVKLHIPVAHVEAGLRSFNRRMPEEINRILADHISSFLFCPTQTAVDNLVAEGINAGTYLVGDVMYDALTSSLRRAEDLSKILDRLQLEPKNYIVATIHRAENTDDPIALENICSALKELAQRGERIVFPAHPRTAARLEAMEARESLEDIVIPPASYLDMLLLQSSSKLIITDSGGMQKEAFWLSIPCVTVRCDTEWIETVKSGWNILTGPDRRKILEAVEWFSTNRPRNVLTAEDGKASDRITAILSQMSAAGQNCTYVEGPGVPV